MSLTNLLKEPNYMGRIWSAVFCFGGKTGIRTLGTVARSPHFECGPIDHSGISPGPSPTLRPVIRSANIAIFRKKSIFGTKKDSNFYFHPLNVFPDFIATFVR